MDTKHSSNSDQTARKEAKEGTMCQTGAGLNLNTEINTNMTETSLANEIPEPEIQTKVQSMSSGQFKEIGNIAPAYTPRL